MKRTSLSRYELSFAALALLAGCGGSQPPIGAPGAMPQSPAIVKHTERGLAQQQTSYQWNAASEAVIYSFGSNTPDGVYPAETLTDVHGTLYGETYDNTGYSRSGNGTVFTVTPSGDEAVLHKVTDKQGRSFSQLTLGPKSPSGGLALYGTGHDRGAYGHGTIVRVSLSGAVTVLHDFAGGNDGASPTAGLIDVDGTFYGTTSERGAYSSGTVFSVTPSGTENVIYAFHGGKQDGRYPYASLVNLNGTLYGTTVHGGAHSLGTVFSVTPSGTEQVLHSFQGKAGDDGAFPYAGLTVVNGTLYGTTSQGGVGCGSVSGCGTVFSITPSGTETVIYSFACKRDGCFPYAPLLALNGKLYGTAGGGAKGSSGVVFSVTPSGTERVLHDFVSSEGSYLFAGLINIHRMLYGTTPSGGTYNDGTVYSVTL
jgi:uncharacterized repeat protein (TIGR03803 family)